MSSSHHGYQFILTLASQGVTKQALVCTGSLLFAWGLWIFILFVGSCLHLDSTALALAASVCGMWSSHLAPYPSTGHPMYTITTTSCYSRGDLKASMSTGMCEGSGGFLMVQLGFVGKCLMMCMGLSFLICPTEIRCSLIEGI